MAARAEVLTSSKNPLLKQVRRAIVQGSLTADGCCIAEGFHLLEEALRSGCRIEQVLAAESVRSAVEGHIRGLAGVRLSVVPDGLFRRVASTENSQGVIALVKPPAWSLENMFRGQALVVVIDGVQDPGNAGTILRAAEAFGATGVMMVKGTVSVFHSKTIRASAGSVFRVPFVAGLDAGLARAALDQGRLDVYAAVPRGSHTLREVDLKRRTAFVIGGEGHGVSQRLRAGAMELSIPTTAVESLNAAMAASILLYEAARQRFNHEPV